MKQVGVAIVVVLILNLLAAAGFVAWLGATDRLSPERVQQVVDLFTPTLEEAQQAKEKEEQQLAQATQRMAEVARLQAVAGGPKTLEQKLAEDNMTGDIQNQILDRLKAESASIQRRLASSKQVIAQLKSELDEQRQAMEQYADDQKAKQESEDFQQAVTFYEQLKPKQAKGIFQNLLEQGKTQEVLDYLAAMQLRKAGSILREFKSDPEVVQATQLLEALRQRGLDMVTQSSLSKGGGA